MRNSFRRANYSNESHKEALLGDHEEDAEKKRQPQQQQVVKIQQHRKPAEITTENQRKVKKQKKNNKVQNFLTSLSKVVEKRKNTPLHWSCKFVAFSVFTVVLVLLIVFLYEILVGTFFNTPENHNESGNDVFTYYETIAAVYITASTFGLLWIGLYHTFYGKRAQHTGAEYLQILFDPILFAWNMGSDLGVVLETINSGKYGYFVIFSLLFVVNKAVLLYETREWKWLLDIELFYRTFRKIVYDEEFDILLRVRQIRAIFLGVPMCFFQMYYTYEVNGKHLIVFSLIFSFIDSTKILADIDMHGFTEMMYSRNWWLIQEKRYYYVFVYRFFELFSRCVALNILITVSAPHFLVVLLTIELVVFFVAHFYFNLLFGHFSYCFLALFVSPKLWPAWVVWVDERIDWKIPFNDIYYWYYIMRFFELLFMCIFVYQYNIDDESIQVLLDAFPWFMGVLAFLCPWAHIFFRTKPEWDPHAFLKDPPGGLAHSEDEEEEAARAFQ